MITDFSSIITEGGETYLHNPSHENVLNARLERLNSHYQAIRDLLKENDLPGNRDNVEAIARDGSDGMKAVIRGQMERDIKRLCISKHLAFQFRAHVLDSVDNETLEKADELARRISSDGNDLPLRPEDYVFTEDAAIDADAVRKRIAEGCRIRITPTMREEADKVLKLAKELRVLELTGLNCIELATRYARAGEAPSEAELFRAVAFRRHQPGAMGFDEGMARVFNETALKAAGIL